MNAPGTAAGRWQPLAGVRVVEMSYGIAAPLTGRYLAALGADVVKIESARRPDGLRQAAAPWIPADVPRRAGLDANALFNYMNTGKRGVVIEMDRPAGRRAAHRLLRSADAYVTNLAPEALEKLGISYDQVAPENPEILYVAISTFGDRDSGPFRSYRTWGHNVGAFCGLCDLTGFPEDPPLMWNISITDYIGAYFGTATMLAGLIRRRREGRGEYIDLALSECVAAALEDRWERARNGEAGLGRRGNHDPRQLVQDVFPIRGEDRWLALTVRDSSDARALAGALPGLEGLTEPAELSAAVALALAALDEEQVRATLAAVAIPWEVVANVRDVLQDSRLRDGFWQLTPHRRLGREMVSGLPLIRNGVRAADRRGAPALGEHTREVLADLGFGADEVDALVAGGDVALLAEPERRLERPWLARTPFPFGGEAAVEVGT